MASIVEDLKEVFELPRAGNVPVHSQGSHWINHKRKALQRVIDRYGAYIAHLTAPGNLTNLEVVPQGLLSQTQDLTQRKCI